MDVVDPHFDFLREQNGKGDRSTGMINIRRDIGLCDGMLVSRAIVGDAGRGASTASLNQ